MDEIVVANGTLRTKSEEALSLSVPNPQSTHVQLLLATVMMIMMMTIMVMRKYMWRIEREKKGQ